MKYTPTDLPGVFVVEPEPHADERGFFARLWCPREFAAHGLNPNLAQVSVSYNRLRGTVRGMHYQAAPHAEAKLVRCTRGFVKISSVAPYSTSSPRWKKAVRCDTRAACCMLCVTIAIA